MGKRGNKQGSAIKRGNTWTAVITEGYTYDPEAKKIKWKRRWVGGFKTKRDALRYACDPPEDIARPAVPTLDHYHKLWLHSAASLSKDKQTAYVIAWRRMESLHNTPVDEIKISNLQAVIDKTTTTYYPARDVKSLASNLFKLAIADGYITNNITSFLVLPKNVEKETKTFSDEDMKRFWDAFNDPSEEYRDEIAGILLMCYTGMMPGELFKLRKSNFDKENREIRGAGLKTDTRRKAAIVYPKLLDPVVDYMFNAPASKKINDPDRVLQVGQSRFYKSFRIIMDRYGFKDVKPYSCRHTTATKMASSGEITLTSIAQVMRHSQISTTARYVHTDTSVAHDAVAFFDKKDEEAKSGAEADKTTLGG